MPGFSGKLQTDSGASLPGIGGKFGPDYAKSEYDAEITYYKFLKQYLTLHRSELFFADKAIFVEGDTERILLPAIMKKLDQEDVMRETKEGLDPSLPLLSQNVSIIEVGAYSQIFEKFINYIGIKSLVITDIDSVKTVSQTADNGIVKKNMDGTDKTKDVSCLVSEGIKTSNSSLLFFFGEDKSLIDLITFSLEDKILKKCIVDGTLKWVKNIEGHLLCVYQTIEINDSSEEYCARSFEDAFFHINNQFISEHTFDESGVFIGNETFPSLRQTGMKQFAKSEISAWQMANAVSKKPPFAIEILLNSKNEDITLMTKDLKKVSLTLEFSNWNIPAYIRKGLQWLKID